MRACIKVCIAANKAYLSFVVLRRVVPCTVVPNKHASMTMQLFYLIHLVNTAHREPLNNVPPTFAVLSTA
jgi:hypothetical protein